MQKEKLSALMDGEIIDHEFYQTLSTNKALQKDWYRYHVIRDCLRKDADVLLDKSLADKIAAVINEEPIVNVHQAITEEQPNAERWSTLPFMRKIKPLLSQVGQIGIAACVSLIAIVGYQQYNQPNASLDNNEVAALNTFSIGGLTSPVSYGVDINNSNDNTMGLQKKELEQRKRLAILRDYELQRRLYAQPLDLASIPAAQQVQSGNR